MDKLRVVLHVNDKDLWNTALGNATNLLKDVGEAGADVVILATGSAVTSYANSNYTDTMELLAGKGVKFKACRNSLKNLCAEGSVCISESSLPAFVEVVPAGISELVRRQQEGYAYVKP